MTTRQPPTGDYKDPGVQNPVRVGPVDSVMGQKIEHPAFGTISATRVSGHANLFHSKVTHHGYVVVRIHGATLYEDTYGHDRVHGGHRSYVELAMTEAQWVEFVSRMNMGSGTPCTLLHMPTGPLQFFPRLPDPELALGRYHRIADDVTLQGRERVKQHVEAIRAMAEKLPKKTQEELNKLLNGLSATLNSNLDFAHKTMHEKAEDVINTANVEIGASIRATLQQIGVDSIPQLMQLAHKASEAGITPDTLPLIEADNEPATPDPTP